MELTTITMNGLKAAVVALCVAAGVSAQAQRRAKVDLLMENPKLTAQEMAAGVLTPEVLWKMGRVGAPALSPDGRTVLYGVTEYDLAANKGVTNLYTVPVAGGDAVRLTPDGMPGSDGAWSADGRTIYFVSDRSGSAQVWRMAADGSEARQVTDVKDGIEAFGMAPGGGRMYYVARTKVERRGSAEVYDDLPASKARVYDDLMVRHWNYWDDGSYLHIYVAEVPGDGLVTQGRDIMAGEAWDAPMAPYFDGGEIAWSPDGTRLAYTCKKLTGAEYAVSTDSDIYLYDVAKGTTGNLTEGMPGYDRYPRFSPDGRRIAFTSMARPGNESDKERLFVMDADGGNKRYLTPDFDYNALGVRWSGDGRELYFIAPIEATHQIARVGADGGEVEVLTAGDHDVSAIDLQRGVVVASRMTLSSAPEIYAVDPADGAFRQLTFVNCEFCHHIAMGEVRKRWVPTTDGKRMLTWVVLPPDFDSTKRYPAVLMCQGGPQSVVSQSWSYRWNPQLMAAQGYVVIAPNRRGVPSFGQEWLDQISGDYSGQNIRDYLSAVDNVAAEPWVDAERIGAVGASYGGYSVFYLAGYHEGRFKAFIAHCGMFNLESMYGATEELWFVTRDMGGPYWSPDPVAQRSYAHSPHRFVGKWDTPILIFTGERDYRIPYTESLQAFTAARQHGVPSRLVVFEDEAHQVLKPQNSVVWNREFFGWLDKYLKK
ncbi:MAG: S9 family peptidase [Rikenellaceae bacterium]|nr:S9 family peptidase [Rikenellaceae bacterium]